jgi:glutathione peroxidase
LPKLIDEFGARGFKVLAFPCNQFSGQEPGTNEQILTFVEKYGARDKLEFFEKGDVNGKNTREVFSFLKRELGQEDIR